VKTLFSCLGRVAPGAECSLMLAKG
jgi:hypothetical protein